MQARTAEILKYTWRRKKIFLSIRWERIYFMKIFE